MPERMQYGEIRERIRQIFATPDESCTPEMLQHCCLLIAVMALGTEAVLLDQTSAPKRSDLEAILQNLRQLCSEEIRLVRVEWQRHEKEALQHGLPDDIAREEVEATLYRDLCGMLPITAPLPVMPPDDSMTANAFLAVFPGAGWLTSEEVADRLGQAKYGGEVWQQASLLTKITYIQQMIRHLTTTEDIEAHRHVGEIAQLRNGRLQRVYKLVHDFSTRDWEEVGQYHERMTRYYQGKILDIIPAMVEHYPEGFAQLDLKI